MAEIIIKNQEEASEGWEFMVKVEEGGEVLEYKVFLGRKYFNKLAGENAEPGKFVTKCFKFLLERESKESILKTFDVSVIQKYFSEFEEIISTQ